MRWLPQILCLLVMATFAPRLHAQAQPVYRCIGAHGEPVFSGQPCGTPAPDASNGAAAPGGSGFGAACMASPQALRQAVADAFISHDVNRLAGLLLWRGMDQASARARLQSFSAWLKQPLAGIAIAYATGPPSTSVEPVPVPAMSSDGTSPAIAPQAIGLQVSTGGGDGSTRDFGIEEIGGCWWLSF